MYKTGKIDKKLRRIKIVAINKPGKDANNVANYRPIALLPTITKVTNTAILENIQLIIEKYQLLPSTSFGFRKNRATTSAVDFLTNNLKKNNRNNKHTAVIFIDVKNAYNSVDVTILAETMTRNMISPEDIRWVKNFLTNRWVEIDSDGQTIRRRISNGLPQGDVLSP